MQKEQKQQGHAKSHQPKEKTRLKVVKDLGFLLNNPPTFLTSFTAKYLIQEGEGEVLRDIEVPFQAQVGVYKYDYQGRQVEKIDTLVVSKEKEHVLRQEVMSMRLGEKSWFNVCNRPIHEPTPRVEKVEGGGVIIEDMETVSAMKVEQEEDQPWTEPTGLHYELTLKYIEYRHADKIEAKRKYYTQQREVAAGHFKEGLYEQALRIYRKLINITEGLSRRLYSDDQIDEMRHNNHVVRLNYAKTYLKLNDPWLEREQHDYAEEIILTLAKSRPCDSVAHYLHAKWLLKERQLDPAFAAARRSWDLEQLKATHDLMKVIKEEKERKGKVRRPVELDRQA